MTHERIAGVSISALIHTCAYKEVLGGLLGRDRVVYSDASYVDAVVVVV